MARGLVNAPAAATGGTPQQNLKLVVDPTRQLIGEGWYDPLVDAINNGDSRIRVIKVELRTQSKTYESSTSIQDGGNHPLVIEPGEIKVVPVSFRLECSVWDTFFRHPADLLVYYQDGSQQIVAHATVVGLHLDGSR